jgi:hypothetical protein
MTENEKNVTKPDGDDTVSSFEEMFDSYGEDWTLSIYRESPKELSGFLEEITLSAGENPVNLQYLISYWGGRVLRLMLRDNKGVFRRRMLIQLKSFPPKLIVGDTVEEDRKQKDTKTELIEMMTLAKSMIPPTPAPPPNPFESIVPLLVPIIQAVAQKLMIPPPASQPQSQAASITEMMGALSTMRDFVQPAPEGGDLTPLISIAEKILPAMIEKNKNPMPQYMPPRIVPAAAIPRPSPSPSPPSNQPEKQEVLPTAEPSEEQLMEFAQRKLSSLGGEQLTKMYFDSVARMSQNEQDAAQRTIESVLDLEPLDESTETAPIPIPRGAGTADKTDIKNHRASDKKSG